MVRSGQGAEVSLGTAVEYKVKTGILSDVLRLGLGGSRGQGALSGCLLHARGSGAAYGKDLPRALPGERVTPISRQQHWVTRSPVVTWDEADSRW